MLGKETMNETEQTHIPADLYCVICPVAGDTVTITERHLVKIPGDPAVWWQCPVCQGWHVFFVKNSTLPSIAELMIPEKTNGSNSHI